jgi:hypothetical protein
VTAGQPGFDLLPSPPRLLRSPGFALEAVDGVVAYRLHWAGNLLRPARHPRGKFRFDAPRDGAEYAVTYANLAEHGAFAEVYGDTQLIGEFEATRQLSRLVATRPLNLIPLDDPTVQKALKLDGRIAMSRQYDTTMLWSRALHRWCASADGIRYVSRHAGAEFPNFCLFLDRCRDALEIEALGRLGDPGLRPLMLEAADRYHLAVLIRSAP